MVLFDSEDIDRELSWWSARIREVAEADRSEKCHYANCDGSTVAPVLTVNDFTCFINEFAHGCSTR